MMKGQPKNGNVYLGGRWGIAAWVTAGLVLLPLVAVQFTDEVKWTRRDFLFATVLIHGLVSHSRSF